MVAITRRERKELYFRRFGKILSNYEKCFVVNADNVRSKQMQQIRMALRGSAEVVFGKNTMMRKVILKQAEKDARLEKLLPLMRQNVGLVFTVRDLQEVRKSLESNRLEAPAKAGTIAPKDVTVPAMNTGLGPEKTSFFQALTIATKITRGTIEILNDVPLITKGNKVGASEAKLLQMLKICPFDYGLVITQVYDAGSVYNADILDITTETVLERFSTIASNVTALSLAINYPTIASAPHMLIDGFKNLLAVSVETDYTFKESEQIKEYLKDPSKFAAPAAAPEAPAAAAGKAEAKPAPEPESESDSDMGINLFD